MNRREALAALATGAAVPITALGANQEVPYAVDAGHPEVMSGTIRLVSTLPPNAGPVVSMVVFRDSVVIACERGSVYQFRVEDFA